MLMKVLPVDGSILQGESNRLCSDKTRGLVNNHGVKDMVSPVYILSMGSLEVSLNRREELEHRHIKVVLISVRMFPARTAGRGDPDETGCSRPNRWTLAPLVRGCYEWGCRSTVAENLKKEEKDAAPQKMKQKFFSNLRNTLRLFAPCFTRLAKHSTHNTTQKNPRQEKQT